MSLEPDVGQNIPHPATVFPEDPVSDPKANREELDAERSELLRQVEEWFETPMIVLGFVWLALLVLELTRGLTPGLQTVAWAI